MPDPSPLLLLVEHFRADLLRRDTQALGRLIDAYRRAFSRLGGSLDALMLEVGEGTMTAGQLYRMTRYKSLMGQVSDELMGFQALTVNEAERAAQLGIQIGQTHARQLMSMATLEAGQARAVASFNVLPKGAIESVLGFLQPEGQLYQRLRLIAPNTASLVSDAITSGITMGYGPAKTAGVVQDAFGKGLVDALRQVRTIQLWSYRESNRATYIANSDVVRSWIWVAHLGDARTCMSCISLHGSEHPLSEPLEDHYAGRCAMAPLVVGYDNPVRQSGQEWFEQQSEARQQELMGKGKLQAWQEDRFEFDQLSTRKTDRIYGWMRSETSLKDLVGE